MQIYVSGSLAYDRIMDFPGKFADHILPEKIHILNVCFLVKGLKEKFGGTAGNIAYNLVLLGERPLVLAAVGKDFDRYEEWLQRLGLSLAGVRRIQEEFTGGAYITTDLADNQIIGFNPGAMQYPSDYRFAPEHLSDALAIVAPGNIEDMRAYSRFYQEKKIPYIFDPGQQIPALAKEDLFSMMTGAEIFISNDYELEMTQQRMECGKKDLLKKARAIITTLGEKGSAVCTPLTETRIPAVIPARVKDPTGAGDAYRAGLIKGLIMKKSLVEAAHIGAVCASFSVECYGTQEHHFSEAEFWARHKEQFSAPWANPRRATLGGEGSAPSPAALLLEIQSFFRETGLFGQKLSLEHKGNQYHVSCDDQSFLVYRLNQDCGHPYGAPGWTVCLVNGQKCFEECHSPALQEDPHSCGLGIRDWLSLIRRNCK